MSYDNLYVLQCNPSTFSKNIQSICCSSFLQVSVVYVLAYRLALFSIHIYSKAVLLQITLRVNAVAERLTWILTAINKPYSVANVPEYAEEGVDVC